MFRDLRIPEVLDTSSNDLIKEFFIPILKDAVAYDRGVGYFSSGWLRLAMEGMVAFATHGGKARWITSPILDKDDWEAIREGNEARHDALLKTRLLEALGDLRRNLRPDELTLLAWLVADGIVTFELALPRGKLAGGEFHDKFGVFVDAAGDKLSFIGSYNDSIQGTLNYESIRTFASWRPEHKAFVQDDVTRFETLWANSDLNVRVFSLDDAIREEIVRLHVYKRPYHHRSEDETLSRPGPGVPAGLVLRDYQQEARMAWVKNGFNGILQMATGSGKTITALAGIVSLLERRERLAVVVACPYKHLVEQWSHEAERFGFNPIRAAESRRSWSHELSALVRSFNRGREKSVFVVTTMASLQRGGLREILSGVWEEAILVVDEVHHAGAPGLYSSLPPQVPYRLGLSATPTRYYDVLGTKSLVDYFGGVVFEFGLDKAIGTCLTPYYYHPIPIEMTEDEFAEYCRLTVKLQRLMHCDAEYRLSEAAERVSFQRARVLNNSMAKLAWLDASIEKHDEIHHALFYVGDRLRSPVLHALGNVKRIRVHEFTEKQTNAERKEILERFASGSLQALVAIRCLDEGVDVPPTRIAYFLASSGNPLEFTQRRGRVLRRFEGKECAELYDLISVPPDEFIGAGPSHPSYAAVRAVITREYRRIKEFASLAENRFQALETLFDIAGRLGLLDV